MQNPKYKRRMKALMRQYIEEGRFNPATLKNREMNKLEQRFDDLFAEYAPSIGYVGDGQVWFTARNGAKMNPDFIDLDNRLVIEVTESSGYFHNPQQRRRRREAFEALGWRCQMLTDVDLQAQHLDSTIAILRGLVNGMTLVSKRRLRATHTVSDFECRPHHNYFVGSSGVLSHNSSFQDNSVEFYNELQRALNYGAKSRPRLDMPVGNYMKHHIVRKGLEIGAPLHLSYSCYMGDDVACGQCGPCYLRLKAFLMNDAVEVQPYASYPDWFPDRLRYSAPE